MISTHIVRSRIALVMLLLVVTVAPTGCARRFGGPWPWGQDQTADLAKYGPVAVQRIDKMKERAKQLKRGTAEEREAFAADLAKKMPNETDVLVRMAIVDALRNMDAPSAGAVLFAGLKDPEPDVRIACCEAWAKRPSAKATQMLAETLSSDTDKNVRMAAVKALASAKDPAAVRALGLALQDPDPALQYRAVASLKNVTGEDLGNDVKAWQQLAQRPDPPVRTQTLASRVRQVF